MSSQLLRQCAVALVVVFSIGADDPNPAASTPKSPAAVAAMAKHERAMADAERAYAAAKGKADQTMVGELKKAQTEALKTKGAQGLAEANAIEAVIDDTARRKAPSNANLRDWLVSNREMLYSIHSDGMRKLTFLPGGTIGGKPGPWEKKWRTEGDVLIISGDNGDGSFYRCFDGALRGTWKSGEGVTLRAP